MKARYLMFFSYIGTRFRSSERLWVKGDNNHLDLDSVQGLMEAALQEFRPLNYPNITLSSRTDGGVHALNSSAHVDLERHGTTIFHTHFITSKLNRFFFKHDASIFIKKSIRVNDDFSARFNAKSRTYVYRLAVLKPEYKLKEHEVLPSLIPIEEWKRCHFISNTEFDISRFKEGTKFLEGYHDFTTFKKFDKLLQSKHNRRVIEYINVRQSQPCAIGYTITGESCFNYWDIEIKGRAFVHNQIRRMMGTLISVAIGKLEPSEIKVMLQIPSKHSWHSFICNCPPDGLYLANVEYDPKDLDYNPDIKNNIEVDEGDAIEL